MNQSRGAAAEGFFRPRNKVQIRGNILIIIFFRAPKSKNGESVVSSEEAASRGCIVDEAIPDGLSDCEPCFAQDTLEFRVIRALFHIAGIREHGRVRRPGSVGIMESRGGL